MLERSGETAFDYDLHGGTDTRIQWYFLDHSRLPVAVQLWELPPGGREGQHVHPEHDPLEELYLVVSGRAVMHLDGEPNEVGPGDALFAPVGAEHDLCNHGAETLRVVVVWGRPTALPDWSAFGSARAARAARD